MLLKKIVLDNFQSHKHTEIDIAPTLTVIVGESDNGKSAVARALKWVFYNEPRGSDFIRAGEEKCSVLLEYDDGTIIQRIKNVSGSKNRYVISKPGADEIVLEGFGANVPKEIADITGVRKIKIDDSNELDLYISNQLDAPFMLSESGAVKAKAIGRLTGNYIFDYAHKKAALDINRSREEQKRVLNDIERIEENLKEYSDLPALDDKINKLGKIFEGLKFITDILDKLDDISVKLKSCDREISKLEQITDKLKNIGELENNILNTEILFNQYVNLQKINQNFKENYKKLELTDLIINETKNIQKLDYMASEAQQLTLKIDEAERLSNRYKKVLKNLSITENVIKELGNIKYLDLNIKNIDEITVKYNTIVDIYKKYKINNSKLSIIEDFLSKTINLTSIDKKINEFDVLSNKYTALVSLKIKLEEVNNKITSVEDEAKKYEKYIQNNVKRYEEILKKLKVCPVCNSVITSDMAHEIALNMEKI